MNVLDAERHLRLTISTKLLREEKVPVSIIDVKEGDLDRSKCEDTEQQILDILNQQQLSLRELLFVLACLFIDIGGSLEELDEMLTRDDMWRRYAIDPTIGNTMIALGGDILYEWLELKGDFNGTTRE
ncbi:MAG: hypothetical protein DRN26_00430 [Thermoplasmata archaeon]|nr:MAG: hypothetical protein DRN26_00430 [Thermoplasmata archaeon]